MKILATLTLTLACASVLDAATLALNPSKDNSIYSEGALSNGQGVNLFAGNNGTGATRRALLAFDLGAIPAGATVESVSLSLFLTVASSSTAQTVTLSRLTADWGEGSSLASGNGGGGAAAATGDATWLDSFYSASTPTAWTSPGGDFAATPSASTSVTVSSAFYTWSSAGLVADVQAWVNGTASNDGWVLRGNESGSGTAKAFASGEASTPSQQPLLTITYTAVPEPGTLGIGLAVLVLAAARSRARRRG